MATWHIEPINDLKEHEQASTCPCNPKVEVIPDTGDLLIIHNSYDGREQFEYAFIANPIEN